MEKKKEIARTDEEKMKKKIKSINEIVSFAEGVFIVPIVITLVILIIGLCQFLFLHKTTYLGSTVRTFNHLAYSENETEYTWEDEKETELTWEDIRLLANKLLEKENEETIILGIKNDKLENVSAVCVIILLFVDYIMYILIIENIAGIFKEILNFGTPFTEKTINNMKKIRILSTILIFVGIGSFTLGLMPFILILALTSIFGYGYKLQKESDETL